MALPKHSSPWEIRTAGLSDVGRVREHNEDRYLVDLDRSLFIVSDGMGGHQAGEVASEAVVTVLPPLIEQYISRHHHMLDKSALYSGKAIERILQGAIRELSQRLRTES